MRRFFAPPESFNEGRVALSEQETRHLRDVLRLRPGDSARVFDGSGIEYLCQVKEIGKRSALLDVVEPVQPASPESPLDLTLAVAVLKGEKFDLVVQKAAELGVVTVIPLITARGDVKIKDTEKRVERWRKIALEAVKQCGRARLMTIAEPIDLASSSVPDGESILFSERGGTGFENVAGHKKMTAFIGPEGGWDDAELELAGSRGIRIVTFGGRIMRAETAAIAITAILQHRFGDIN